jgi:hypothetical protein
MRLRIDHGLATDGEAPYIGQPGASDRQPDLRRQVVTAAG